MAIAAAIRFVQGANVGTAGIALFGVLATSVVASNGNNTGVVSWKWTMLDAPVGSAIPVGLISDGATSTATFSPDLVGGYHLELTARAADGSTKTARLVFQVKEPSGRYVPPFRAESPALNFASLADRGWANPMDQWLREIDGRAPLVNAGTGNLDDVVTKDGQGVDAYSLRLSGAAPVLRGLAGGRDGRRLWLFCPNATTIANEAAGDATAANRITTGSGADATVTGLALLVYDATTSRWRLLSGGGAAAGPSGTLANASTGAINDAVSTNAGLPVAAMRFTGAAPTLNGIASPTDARYLVLEAFGGPLILAHEAVGSTAANRIVTSTSANVTVPQGAAAFLVYDPTSSRWRLSGVGVVGGGGAASVGTSGQVDASDGAGGWLAPSNIFAGANFISIGASPALSGAIRHPSTGAGVILAARNSGGTGDLSLISGNGTDIYAFGTTNATIQMFGASLAFYANGAQRMGISGTLINAALPVEFGATGSVSTTGTLRMLGGSQTHMLARNNAGSGNVPILAQNTSNEILFGTDAAFSSQAAALRMYATDVYLGVGSTNHIQCTSGATKLAQPIGGLADALKLRKASIVFSGSDVTLSSAQSENPILVVSGSGGTMNIIAPASNSAVYIVDCLAGIGVGIQKSGGTPVNCPSSKITTVYFNGTDYKAIAQF